LLLDVSREEKGGLVVRLLAWDVAANLHCGGPSFLCDLGEVV